MSLTGEELQERPRGDGSQAGPCVRLSGADEHTWGAETQGPPWSEGSQEVLELI